MRTLTRPTSASRALRTLDAHFADRNRRATEIARRTSDDPLSPDPEPPCETCGTPLVLGKCLGACSKPDVQLVCVECDKRFTTKDRFAVTCPACHERISALVAATTPRFEHRRDRAKWDRIRRQQSLTLAGWRVGDRAFYVLRRADRSKAPSYLPGTIENITPDRLVMRLDQAPEHLRTLPTSAVVREVPSGALAS